MSSVTQTHVYMSARTLKAIGDWVMSDDSPGYADGVTLVIDPYDGSITVVDPYNERCRKFEAWPTSYQEPVTPPPPNTKVGGKV